MEVDRDADLVTQGLHEFARGERLAEACHVLDGEHVGAELLQFLGELHVVVERILRPLRVEDVAGVADRRLADRAALEHRVDRHLHVRHPVERIEHAEHVDAAGGRLLHEGLHDVVGIIRVADGVARAQEHLEEDVGHQFAELGQPVPWAFLEEPHRRVERSPAPHLQREEARRQVGVGIGDGDHVERPHPRGEQRLVGVAHRRVGDEETVLLPHPGGKLLRADFLELGPCAGRRGGQPIKLRHRRRRAADRHGAPLHERVAVDDHVGQILEHPSGPVATEREVEERRRFVDEPRGATAGEKVGVCDEVDQERDVGLHAADAEFLQAAFDVAGGLLVGQPPRRHLHQQRVEIGRDDCAGEGGAGVEPDAHAAGRPIGRDPAVVGEEAVLGILRGDAALDRRTHRLDLRLFAKPDLRIGELPALRHAELAADDVDACDLLRDRVFHLDSWIDLDEVKAVGIGVDEKLDGAGVLVAGGPSDRQRRLTDGIPHSRGEVGGGGHLHHLLVPTLHRAVTLEEVDEVAVHIAEQLHLDVPRPLDELLDEHARAAEGGLALPLRAFERHSQLVLAADDPHAAAAAAVGRLDHHGPAQFLCDRERFLEAADRLRAARQDRHARLLRQFTSGGLVAERLQQLHAGADEHDPRLLTGRGKLRIFGEEAVARMDRVDIMLLGDRHDPLDVEVGPNRLTGPADEIGFIGLETVEGEAVFVGIDGHGPHAEFVGGAKHADRDLAAVGDQQLLDGTHRKPSSQSPSERKISPNPTVPWNRQQSTRKPPRWRRVSVGAGVVRPGFGPNTSARFGGSSVTTMGVASRWLGGA